jgi:ABC-type sugar transport system ATPase subunit
LVNASRATPQMGRIGRVNTPLVDVSALWVRFGPVDAVRGIDLSVQAGSATALLGRNGAGKSTTMRVLAGVIPHRPAAS